MSTGIKRIEFPPMDAQEQAKFKRFLDTASDFMSADIEAELMTVVVAKVDVSRKDVVTVLSRVQSAQRKKLKEEEKVSKK